MHEGTAEVSDWQLNYSQTEGGGRLDAPNFGYWKEIGIPCGMYSIYMGYRKSKIMCNNQRQKYKDQTKNTAFQTPLQSCRPGHRVAESTTPFYSILRNAEKHSRTHTRTHMDARTHAHTHSPKGGLDSEKSNLTLHSEDLMDERVWGYG